MVLADVLIRWQRLAGIRMQEGFAQQFAVGCVTEIVYLTASAFVGQNLQHFKWNGDGNFLDLLFLFTVLGIRLIYSPFHSAMIHLLQCGGIGNQKQHSSVIDCHMQRHIDVWMC